MIGSFITTIPTPAKSLLQSFLAKHQITQVIRSPYSLHLVPFDLWLLQKLKSPLKGKRFQTIGEIQENTMVTGRTVWGPKLPTLKGTEASLSYLQCFLYLVCSLINVSVFHSVWLDIFWTDLIYALHLLYPIIHQRALRFFTCLGYCKYCCNEHISIYIYTNKSFQNLGYILRRRIAVAYSRSTLNFLRNLSTYCFL